MDIAVRLDAGITIDNSLLPTCTASSRSQATPAHCCHSLPIGPASIQILNSSCLLLPQSSCTTLPLQHSFSILSETGLGNAPNPLQWPPAVFLYDPPPRSLVTLDLSGNRLGGYVPSDWKFDSLVEARLERNLLTGTVWHYRMFSE